MKHGEIWRVNLDPTVGSEIRKTRPCVVISPPEMHDHLRTAIVAPMTTGSRPAPFRIAVRHGGKEGLILLDQMGAIDKSRLVKRAGAIAPQRSVLFWRLWLRCLRSSARYGAQSEQRPG